MGAQSWGRTPNQNQYFGKNLFEDLQLTLQAPKISYLNHSPYCKPNVVAYLAALYSIFISKRLPNYRVCFQNDTQSLHPMSKARVSFVSYFVSFQIFCCDENHFIIVRHKDFFSGFKSIVVLRFRPPSPRFSVNMTIFFFHLNLSKRVYVSPLHCNIISMKK